MSSAVSRTRTRTRKKKRTADSNPTGWSKLPGSLLRGIVGRLANGLDYVRFRLVCRGWRNSTPHIPQLPWAMLSRARCGVCRGVRFFDATFGQLVHLPEADRAAGKLACGASRGWIALLDPTMAMLLLNPVTGVEVRLPRFTLYPNYAGNSVAKEGEVFVFRSLKDGRVNWKSRFEELEGYLPWKIALSAVPTEPDCVVVTIFARGESLGFCRLGNPKDFTWTEMQIPTSCYIEDILFHKGSFYGCFLDTVFRCDPPAITCIPLEVPHWERKPQFECGWLAECSEGLLLVGTCRECHDVHHTVDGYAFFKVDLDNGRLQLLDPRVLHDCAFFIGTNEVISITPSLYSTCTINCVSLHFCKGKNGVRVLYHYGGNIGGYLSKNGSENSSVWSAVTWFKPNLSHDPS